MIKKKMTKKELIEQITDMVENFEPDNYKIKAHKELAKISLSDKPATQFIIEDYPDFDSLYFKISQGDKFVVKIHINPAVLKGNKKAIKKIAAIIHHMKGV